MKSAGLVILLLFLALNMHGKVVTASLNLDGQAPLNDIVVTIVPPVASSSSTTTLSGSLLVAFDIDTDLDQVSSVNVLSGDMVGSPLEFISTSFLLRYNISTSGNIGVDIFTPSPPSVVNPVTGEFDAAEHTFLINEGILSGELTPFLSPTSTFSTDFSIEPFGDSSSGTGVVTISLQSSDAVSKTYSIEMLYPVSTTTPLDVDGTLIDVVVLGEIKAIGTVTVPLLTEFELWLQENSLPSAQFEELNQFGFALGIQWALGLSASTSPQNFMPVLDVVSPTSTLYTLALPAGGSAGDLTILYATDLGQPFTVLDSAAVSVGNPIPGGTTGLVTITLPSSGRGFIKLSATEP
ncbi:MAG: hypothetical protein ACSHX4_01820 [Opitutaceae bacterium]